MKKIIPKLIIHGGAGLVESSVFTFKQYQKALRAVIKESYGVLTKGTSRQAVLHSIKLLEDNPLFNAGYGSRLQKDGEVRMSAAIMDSKHNKFSGVINIRNVRYPIEVADMLGRGKYTVLSGEKATEFARRKKVEFFNPVAPHRLQEHAEKLKGETGTVGVIALDAKGTLCAGTSTGGIGYETPGRVSDSATVAGTYCSKFCGVSCTGKGEQIVNLSVASRIVIQVESGIPLEEAVGEVVYKAKSHKMRFGLIALDADGNMAVGNGFETRVLYATHDGKKVETFNDAKAKSKQ